MAIRKQKKGTQTSESSFGQRVASARRERGLTQGELADKTGVHISHIQRIEANNSQPTVDVLKRLAEALEVSLDLLVFERASEVATRQMVDRELVAQFAAIEDFNDTDKQAIKTILAAMIVKQRVEAAVR
jgi:transcriptional regulator with XRE-family HTH domain